MAVRQRHGKILNSSTHRPCPQDTAHFQLHWNNVLWKRTANWLNYSLHNQVRHVEMDARRQDVGSLEPRPAILAHNSKGSHRIVWASPRKIMLMQAPTPGQASQRRASSCLQKTPGACIQGPRGAGEDYCSLFKRTCCGLSAPDSAQKTPGLSEEHSFANLSASAGGVGQMKVSLGTEALRRGITGLLPTCWAQVVTFGYRNTHSLLPAAALSLPTPRVGPAHEES